MNDDQITDDFLKRIEYKINKQTPNTNRTAKEKELESKNIERLRNKQS